MLTLRCYGQAFPGFGYEIKGDFRGLGCMDGVEATDQM